MNDIHSGVYPYLDRWLTDDLRAASKAHPVVVLTGARQVGKSTLLLNADPFQGWAFHTLDDLDTLRQATEAPESIWAGRQPVIIDEVQKLPELLTAVKRAVDRGSRSPRFILSGSANLLLMKHVSESLAGRAVYLVLDPMTLGEAQGRPATSLLADLLSGRWPAEGEWVEPRIDPIKILLRGLMPPLLRLDQPSEWVRWWQGYVSTYLERDLRQLAQIEAILDFRRVMELAALRTGQLVNQTEIARDARISQPTVHRYLNLLETTHLFERLPAYTASSTTRLLKSPKAFWSDPALAVFLAGYYGEADLRGARELGAFFESLIYHHLRVAARGLTPGARLSFWRTQTGTEVDFVIEHGRRLLALEVKLSPSVGYREADGLRAFLAAHPHATGGVLVHTGTAIRRLDERIVSLPWQLLTG